MQSKIIEQVFVHVRGLLAKQTIYWHCSYVGMVPLLVCCDYFNLNLAYVSLGVTLRTL